MKQGLTLFLLLLFSVTVPAEEAALDLGLDLRFGPSFGIWDPSLPRFVTGDLERDAQDLLRGDLKFFSGDFLGELSLWGSLLEGDGGIRSAFAGWSGDWVRFSLGKQVLGWGASFFALPTFFLQDVPGGWVPQEERNRAFLWSLNLQTFFDGGDLQGLVAYPWDERSPQNLPSELYWALIGTAYGGAAQLQLPLGLLLRDDHWEGHLGLEWEAEISPNLFCLLAGSGAWFLKQRGPDLESDSWSAKGLLGLRYADPRGFFGGTEAWYDGGFRGGLTLGFEPTDAPWGLQGLGILDGETRTLHLELLGRIKVNRVLEQSITLRWNPETEGNRFGNGLRIFALDYRIHISL